MSDNDSSNTVAGPNPLDLALHRWTALDRDWKAVILGTLVLVVVLVS
jgi:hypothetical protein